MSNDNEQRVREIGTQRKNEQPNGVSTPPTTLHPTKICKKTRIEVQRSNQPRERHNTPEITAHDAIYTQPPLFDDPRDQRDNEQKRKLAQTEDDDEKNSGDETEAEPREKRQKISTEELVHKLIETMNNDRIKNKEFISDLTQSLNEERKLNAKLTTLVEGEIGH